MKTKNALTLGIGLILLTLIYSLILYPFLPEKIPLHWNLRGEPDGWGEKLWATWLLPGTMLLLVWLIRALPAMSPGEFRITPFQATFNYVIFLLVMMMGYLQVITLQAALHPEGNWGRAILSGIFLFLGLIGNVMGRIRRNFWMGIRTPWTLADPKIWDATHRLAGKLLFAVGIVGAIAVLMGGSPILWFWILMGSLLIPAVYSYALFRWP